MPCNGRVYAQGLTLAPMPHGHALEAGRHHKPHGCRNAQVERITCFIFKKDRADPCCARVGKTLGRCSDGRWSRVAPNSLTTDLPNDGIRTAGGSLEIPRFINTCPPFGRRAVKGGRVRFIPLDNPARLAAVEFAQDVVRGRDSHMGNPANELKQNLRRFDYVMEKFGITFRELGVTPHGLRHEVLIQFFGDQSGEPSVWH